MAAVMLLDLEARLLGPGDLDLVESMIRGSRTWAYVDDLAGHMAGSLLLRYPELAPRIDAWAVDDNFWIRRSALLAQLLPLKQGAPFDTSPATPTRCSRRRNSSFARRSAGCFAKPANGGNTRCSTGSFRERRALPE